MIGFYLAYFIEFSVGFMKFKNWDQAYKNISFELEAFQNQENLDYLQGRKLFAQWRND